VALRFADRLYVFNRGDHPVMVFAQDGSFLQAWGEDCSRVRTACTSDRMTRCIARTT